MAAITIDSLSVSYSPGERALQEVCLQVEHAEFLALIGPSGSGKTTLLNAVAGFLTPASGTITIGTQIVADPARGTMVPPDRRGLGMVFQESALWPHLNVARNIDYPLRRARVSAPERTERTQRALELVGLEGFGQRLPATLSGGQRQRVALARALVSNPRVLLLDEALSALDEPLRDRLRIELARLTRELSLTVVHVTHDRAEALALADRVAVLHEGTLLQADSPAQLLQAPGHPFVAVFLADATLLPGLVREGVYSATDLPIRFPATGPDGKRVAEGPAQAAILPEHIRARSPHAVQGNHASVRAGMSGARAIVSASLFGAGGWLTVIEWGGFSFRLPAVQQRLAPGQYVAIEVSSGLVYPCTQAAGAVD